MAGSSCSSSQGFRDHLTRQVILGRSEPARKDDEIRARQSTLEDLGETAAVVADDSLRAQLDAQRRQTTGEKQ